jgi:hypothetical protein
MGSPSTCSNATGSGTGETAGGVGLSLAMPEPIKSQTGKQLAETRLKSRRTGRGTFGRGLRAGEGGRWIRKRGLRARRTGLQSREIQDRLCIERLRAREIPLWFCIHRVQSRGIPDMFCIHRRLFFKTPFVFNENGLQFHGNKVVFRPFGCRSRRPGVQLAMFVVQFRPSACLLRPNAFLPNGLEARAGGPDAIFQADL